jgi:hypothetical protein
VYVPPAAPIAPDAATAGRAVVPLLPITARHDSFAEVEQTLSEEQAIREASRCLRCDLQTEDAKRQLVQLSG